MPSLKNEATPARIALRKPRSVEPNPIVRKQSDASEPTLPKAVAQLRLHAMPLHLGRHELATPSRAFAGGPLRSAADMLHDVHRTALCGPRRLSDRWSRLMANYRIRIGEEWQSIFVKGRDEWALLELMSMGELGTTPLANPAPRWSSYVFNLRRMGVNIETIHESHRGSFPGHHGRYILRSWVQLEEARDVA